MPSLDQSWRKSTRSSLNGACVEVRRAAGTIEVRDTKDRSGPVLSFQVDQWKQFVGGVRRGEFDR
jgi:predicted secreted Zn-dependent protease